MDKSLEEYWRDWENNAFGVGYGTGEVHTVPALRQFLAACQDEGLYDYRVLEQAVTPVVAWLLINTLRHARVLEYGTSSRFGWLTESGRKLRAFVLSKTNDELYSLAADHDEDAVICYPGRGGCNCGPKGYDAKRICQNPFWPNA